MATVSRIGMERKDGTIESIYCHYDGYLEHNGKILFESYNNQQEIEALLKLGNIGSLGKYLEPPKGTAHSFRNPIKNVVIAYGRDNSEKNQEAKQSSNNADFIDLCRGDCVEYVYLYSESTQSWKYASYYLLSMGTYEDLQDTLEYKKIIEPQVKKDAKYETAFVGIQRKDGTEQGLYCIYDGYLESAGRLLYENYNNLEAATQLSKRGNVPSLSRMETHHEQTIGIHNFPEFGYAFKYCRNMGINHLYLYNEGLDYWLAYQATEEGYEINKLEEELGKIQVIDSEFSRQSQVVQDINPVTYPKELYELYPDYFGDIEAVYYLMHKMRNAVSANDGIDANENIQEILEKYCHSKEKMNDYLQLLNGRIDKDVFEKIQTHCNEEMIFDTPVMDNQSM